MNLRAALHTAVIYVLDRLDIHSSVRLRRQGPLLDDGWFRSFRENRPVSASGEPIPWLTYAAIDFLASRVTPDWHVFEYGCGHSTLWWSSRVSSVTAVEHDINWARSVQARLTGNGHVVHVPAEPARTYTAALADTGRSFNVIVIDGVHRPACLDVAHESLSEDGVIVLDNSERDEYHSAIDRLIQRGFRHVEFNGLVPGVCWKSRTTIFYRDGNCLGL